jgi:hypothetical protein
VIGIPTAANTLKALRQGGLVTCIGFLEDNLNFRHLEDAVKATEGNDLHLYIGKAFPWEDFRKYMKRLLRVL